MRISFYLLQQSRSKSSFSLEAVRKFGTSKKQISSHV